MQDLFQTYLFFGDPRLGEAFVQGVKIQILSNSLFDTELVSTLTIAFSMEARDSQQ